MQARTLGSPLSNMQTDLNHSVPNDSSLNIPQSLVGRIAIVESTPSNQEASIKEGRLCYSEPPHIPLIRSLKRLLFVTELPFMIMWVYSTYWLTIISLDAKGVPRNVWYAAIVAGILVGVALNANAYKYIVKPRSRSRTRELKRLEENIESTYLDSTDTELVHRENDSQSNANIVKMLLHYPRMFKRGSGKSPHKEKVWFSKNLASMNKFFPEGVQWSLDYGTMIRFFVIPFGVSSLAGVCSYHRDSYYLVFPKDEEKLIISLMVPTVVVTFLFLIRVAVILRIKVQRQLKVFFFNGCLIH